MSPYAISPYAIRLSIRPEYNPVHGTVASWYCCFLFDRGAIAESSRGLERSENPRNRNARAIASWRYARIVVTNTASPTMAMISGIPSGCGPREATVCRGSTLRFDSRLLSVTPSASSCNQGLMPEHSGRRTVASVKSRMEIIFNAG